MTVLFPNATRDNFITVACHSVQRSSLAWRTQIRTLRLARDQLEPSDPRHQHQS
jgi:hypothetical protein